MTVTAASAYLVATSPLQSGWLILAALTLLTGSFSIKLPGINARVSVSETFVFAAVLLFGPAPATLVVALDTVVLTSWKSGTARSRLRGLFNMSAGTAAIWTAAHLYQRLLPAIPRQPSLEQFLFPVLTLAGAYFLINSALVAAAVGFESRRPALAVWHQNFAWLSLNYLGGASVATLLVTYTRDIDLTVLGVIIPLLVITYLTFRTSLGRLDDAHRHVGQLNELYFSTIEALAMAVDAKDQITHGHIRRVQHYAVELAKRLGVQDPLQLKAIEAAALLHDMGKLAIPDHILNKPGKLTTAEFATMKTHAALGADLLSTIPFPYPVVPIVRHHHEQWDGNGYPDGISGTDIPLGARILSVVDCFDALNSDRPYRRKLTLDEAFDILITRRGIMYDPLVVDTFVASYSEIAEGAKLAGNNAPTLTSAGRPEQSDASKPLGAVTVSARDAATLVRAREQIRGQEDAAHALHVVARCLSDLTPATEFALFEYSVDEDSLYCSAVVGEQTQVALHSRIRVGDRVSGWVAATRRTALNSDAALELMTLAPYPVLLRSTLSTPVLSSDRLLGVLTVFSTNADAFSAGHAYVIEQIAIGLADHLSPERRVVA